MARILIVEDDPVSQRIAREALQEHELWICSNYEEAKNSLKLNNVNLILLDIILPAHKSGLDLLSYIRSTPRLHNVLVLITSVKNSDEAKVTGLSVGADGYLPKPFAIPVLKAHVNGMLRREPKGFRQILGPIEFDMANKKAYELKENSRKKLDLRPQEISVLFWLVIKSGHLVTTKELKIQIGSNVSIDVIRSYVSRIRKEISHIFFIDSVKNHGFILEYIQPDSFAA